MVDASPAQRQFATERVTAARSAGAEVRSVVSVPVATAA